MQIKGKQIKDGTISIEKLDFPISYTHVQVNPLSVWNVTHTFGRHTNVTIYDENNEVIEGEINYISDFQFQVIFNDSVAGLLIIS